MEKRSLVYYLLHQLSLVLFLLHASEVLFLLNEIWNEIAKRYPPLRFWKKCLKGGVSFKVILWLYWDIPDITKSLGITIKRTKRLGASATAWVSYNDDSCFSTSFLRFVATLQTERKTKFILAVKRTPATGADFSGYIFSIKKKLS